MEDENEESDIPSIIGVELPMDQMMATDAFMKVPQQRPISGAVFNA